MSCNRLHGGRGRKRSGDWPGGAKEKWGLPGNRKMPDL